MALSAIDHLDKEQSDCLDSCFAAVQACEWCADRCAAESEEMARCIRLCRDVADIAVLHAQFLVRDSNYSPQLTEACAGACQECAEECARHETEHCQVCADVLSDCAEVCRSLMATSSE
jgi:hypothetical protein